MSVTDVPTDWHRRGYRARTVRRRGDTALAARQDRIRAADARARVAADLAQADQVADLVRRGYTTGFIAGSLDISVGAVALARTRWAGAHPGESLPGPLDHPGVAALTDVERAAWIAIHTGHAPTWVSRHVLGVSAPRGKYLLEGIRYRATKNPEAGA